MKQQHGVHADPAYPCSPTQLAPSRFAPQAKAGPFPTISAIASSHRAILLSGLVGFLKWYTPQNLRKDSLYKGSGNLLKH